MIRTLAMISLAGLVLSVVCLSLAVSLAGPEFVSRGGWSLSGPWSDHGHRHDSGGTTNRSDDGDRASRDLAWSGGDTLEIALPAEVRYVQAAGPAKLTVRGSDEAIRHVRVQNGRLEFDAQNIDPDDLTVELSAPNVSRFVVSGSGRLAIQDYKQPKLTVRISGDGQVTAKGAADSATVEITGSGDADLAALATDGAEVTISGSGGAKVGPKSWAKLNIAGSGNIELLSHPRKLDSQVSGSGHVEQGETDDEGSDASEPVPTAAGKPI